MSCSNLTRELLDYLSVCDSEFKPDLTAKIAALITRYAPDRRWHYDNLLCVLVQVRRVQPKRWRVETRETAARTHTHSLFSLFPPCACTL